MNRRSPHPFRAAVALAAAVLVLALGACSSSDSAGSDGSSTDGTTVESTTTAASDPTTTEATATTAPPAPTGLASPREAATRLYDSWFADDRATAASVAVPEAVDGMWLTERGDYALYNDCDSAEFDTSGCLFRGNAGTIQFTMERSGDLWIVIEAFYSAG